MSENSTRRSVLKKLAATGIAGSALLGSTGTAAAADSSYKIIVEHDGSGQGEYKFTVDDGGDGDCSVVEVNDTVESDDQFSSNSDGSITVDGFVDSSDTYDKFKASEAGELTVSESQNCTVYKST